MPSTPALEPNHDNDAREYKEFCSHCGLLLADGLQLWQDSLKRLGLTDRAVQVKVAAAAMLLRRMGYLS